MAFNPNSTGAKLELSGTTSGNISQFASAVTASYSLIWPAAQAASSGYVLTNDGAGHLSWAPTAAAGVTSVSASVPSFLSVIVSNPTTTPNIAITLSGTALPVANGGTGLATIGTNGQVLTVVGGVPSWTTPAAGGVTSVNLSAPSFLIVSGNPVTTAGTLALALDVQNANLVFAGPATGSAAEPTFRSLVAADIPSLSGTYLPLSGGALTGAVTSSSTITASNLSGTNTGNVTLAAVGSSPNANAASLSGQVLNLQPFNSSFPGVVTASGGGTTNFLRADGTWAAAGTALIFADSLVNTGGTVTLVNDSASPGNTKYYGTNGSGILGYYPITSGGVTSVNLSAPSIFIVSGNPVTTTGTLALALDVQSANMVFAGPASGSAAEPTFRALVSADIPSLSGTYLPLAGGALTGAVTSSSTIAASNLSGTNTGDQTITLTGGVTGSGTGSFVATVVTNANLTGVVTSVGNATSIANGAITNAMLATSYNVNIFTLSGTDITNKFVTLSSAPDVAAKTILTVIGGPMQSYGLDYTVSSTNLSWSGLFLDGVLASGDILVVQYD